MRRAFTLPELMLVLALAGILMGIVTPPLSQAADRLEVQTAASLLVNAHQRARIMAIAKGQMLTLTIDSAVLTITSQLAPTPLWSGRGPAGLGVALTGSARRFTFAPEGYTMGLSNASLHLARGSATRTVIFSRAGRVRITQ
jgi:prepilin-type N-terminal cleavage/methylation domain-containing protein